MSAGKEEPIVTRAKPGPRAATFRYEPALAWLAVGWFLVSCIGKYGVPSDTSQLPAAESETSRAPSLAADVRSDYDDGRPGAKVSVLVSLERRYQTLEGFGAALAWHHERITGPTTPDRVYDVLFPELGLDILRFRNRYQRSETIDRNLRTEVEILERATKALGHPPRLLLTSWSPPAALKASGRERCRKNPDCTLKKENGQFVYQQFAEYWVDSLAHYQSMGIVPEFISIQNEPDFIPPDWEGCQFAALESPQYPGYGKALAAVHARLSKLPGMPKFLGPEVTGLRDQKTQRYLAGLEQGLLYGAAHHLYQAGAGGEQEWQKPGPVAYVQGMQLLGQSTRLPLFQTEFGTEGDQGNTGGFETAWLIHASLVEEGVVAFVYWDLIWDGMRGLVGMVGRDPRIRDQYYAVRHFARYTDPGHVRVQASSDQRQVLASAWIAPDEQSLTVVLLNVGAELAEVSVDVGAFETNTATAHRTTFRPGQSERWTQLGTAAPGSPWRLPSRSMVTVVFQR